MIKASCRIQVYDYLYKYRTKAANDRLVSYVISKYYLTIYANKILQRYYKARYLFRSRHLWFQYNQDIYMCVSILSRTIT